MSLDADVFPRYAPDKSDLIDGAIGELSMFHETYGYYAHGIDDTTATLPAGWANRLVPINNENTGGAIGWCLDVHDLALSKLVAGRDKISSTYGCSCARRWPLPACCTNDSRHSQCHRIGSR